MTDEKTSGGEQPERVVMLPSGHTVSAEFRDALRTQIQEVMHVVQHGVPYTVEQMCGVEFWDPLFDLERQDAGRCVAHMVSMGMLPLRFVGCRHARPKRYERI